MRLELLQAFLNVVETGSFLAAARLSGLTQSAISRQIQALEEAVGAPLLHRKSPVALTVAGERLLPHARRICQEWQRAQESIREWLQGQQTELCIAGIHSLIAHQLPPVLQQFCREYPEVQLRVTALGSDRALKVLRDGLVDVALVMENPLMTRGAELVVEPLYSEPIQVLMPATHPLSRYERIPWKVLAEYPQAVFKDGYAMRSLVGSHLARQGLPLKAALELNTLDAFRGVVRQGQLIALLPESALVDCCADPDLQVRPTEPPLLRRQVVMVTTSDRYRIPPIRRFLQLAAQLIRQSGNAEPASGADPHFPQPSAGLLSVL
ncbi:LysR family transcriptional regulator [Synechococcus sp. R8-2]|uniref:LysR family transcriptional regulator n=1 Tax=Synechococcus sp. R8-2 TaxID=2291959 RepID=UPI0039C12D95